MSNLTTRAGKGSPLTNNELDANFTNLNADKVEIGGDLSGTSTAPNVAKIQGRAVSADAPENGEKLVWNGTAWEPSVDPTGEPIGHANKADSTISFDSGTRTFTIAPVAASFTVWCKGVKHTYTSAQTVVIPDTTGLHFIYFNASGVLSTQMSYFTWEEHAPTAYIYWNATAQQAVYFGDERHGITLDWQTHEYLHRTRGAAIASGFGASGYTTTGAGATDADAQIDIGGGTFFDEDLQVDIVSTNTPVAGTWQQDLSGPARIPVLYLSGSAWVIDAPTDFPFKVVSGVPQYNLYSGGTWSAAPVANNGYFVSWILATHNLTYPVIAVISQAATNQVSEAEAMTFEGLTLSGFPSVEFRPLYKVIYQHKTSFANNIKASTIAVYDLRSISAAGVAAALVQDHGNLSGLGDDDHAQYLHVSAVRSPSAAVTNSFLPSQASQSGKYLTTDGSNPSWGAIPSGSLTFTGDVTGTGNTGSSTTLTLANSGVTAGTFTKVTVDAKGRVTNGASASSSDITTALGFTPENVANKAVANGYASLDGSGKVPSNQLPSYVDDVLEYANLAAFPGTGETGKIYVAIDTSKTYRWSGSAYVEISASPGSTDAVTEGSTNLYFTNARARAAVSASGSLSYSTATGIFSYTQPTNVSAFTNDSGYLTGITGAQVTTALGYTPYNATNPNGYITGITSGMVTTALGYTPYNSTNPNGYTSNTGTVTSVSGTGTVSGLTLTGSVTSSGSLTLGGTLSLTSGQVTSALGYTPATVIRGSATVSSAGYTCAFTVTGSGLASAIRFTVQGTTNSVVVNSLVDLVVNHYQDIVVSSLSGIYTVLTVRVVSDGNDSFAVLLTTNSENAANLAIDVFPLNNETITFTSSNPYSGSTLTHQCNPGFATSATGGMSGDINASGAIYASGGNTVLHAGNYGSGYFKTVNGSSIIGTGDVTVSATDNTKLPLSGGNVSGSINLTNRLTGILVNSSSQSSDGGSIAIQQVTAEGWTGIFADYEPYTGWGLWHDNPNNYFCFTAESATSGLRSFTVPSRASGNRTAYEKVRIEQGSGDVRVGGSVYITTSGHLALHAGNYNDYAPKKDGTGASGTWGISITGSSSSASYDLAINQNLNSTGATNSLSAFNAYYPSGGGYNQPIGGGQHFRVLQFGRYNSSDANYWRGQIAQSFYEDRMWFRKEYSQTWGSWRELIHDGNYNSYALPLSGGTLTGGLTGTLGYFSASTQGTPILRLKQEDTSTGYYLLQGLQGSSEVIRIERDGSISIGNYLRIASNNVDWATGNYFRGTNTHFVLGVQNTGTLYLNYGNSGGTCRIDGSTWSPSFYDMDNSAYYLNPAGSSNLSGTVTVNGGKLLVLSDSGGYGQVQINSSNTSTEATLLFGAGGSGQNSGGYTYAGVIGLGAYGLSKSNLYFGCSYSGPAFFIPWTGDYAQASGSFRAPIFYDSNDTGYYTNPNSISSMYGVAIRGDSSSTDTSNQIFFWGSGNTTTSAIGFKANGGYFTNPTGNGDGYNTYLTMDSDGRGWVFRRGVGGADFGAAYTSGWILNNGIWQANASMRSPIFYDSNNTAYYLDPSSSFNFLVTSGTTFYSGGSGVYINNPEGNGQTLRMGAAWSKTGIYCANDITVGSESTINFWTQGVARGYFDSSSNFFANGSARSPIFYDSNDTGYYIDAASASSMSEIRFNGTTSRRMYGASLNGHNAVRFEGNWDNFDVMGRVLDWTGSNLHFGDGYNGTSHSGTYFKIGTVSYLRVGGDIYADGNVVAYYSDARLKQNIETIPNALEILGKIRGVTFEWNKKSEEVWSRKEGEKDFGLISQEVEAVFPMGVAVQCAADKNISAGYGDPNSPNYDPLHKRDNEDEQYKTVKYDKLVALAIQAINEQQLQIAAMSAEINSLKERLQ